MPIIRVTLAAGRGREQKSDLARDITQVVMKNCKVDAVNINILFEEVELEHWLLGSDTITETTGNSDES